MPRYLLSFLFLFYFIFSFYVMFCFVLTSPPLMLCVYLQTFEAALFWKKKKKKKNNESASCMFHIYKIIHDHSCNVNEATQKMFRLICYFIA